MKKFLLFLIFFTYCDIKSIFVTITNPTNNQVGVSPEPIFRGTSDVANTIKLFLDSVEIGNTETNSEQRWSFESLGTLSNGLHNLRVRAQEAFGPQTVEASVNFIVGGAGVTITSPTNGSEFTLNSGNINVSGNTVPNSTVTIVTIGKTAEASVGVSPIEYSRITTRSDSVGNFFVNVVVQPGLNNINAFLTDFNASASIQITVLRINNFNPNSAPPIVQTSVTVFNERDKYKDRL